MTVHEELINYIMSMTPEEVDEFVNHPTFKKVMEEQAAEKEVA